MRPAPRSVQPLFHRVIGDPGAPALLCLHGITGSHRYWLGRMDPLAERYRLFLPDLPGFGDSPKPDEEYTVDFYVRAIRAFALQQRLTDRPLKIVGHSLGALLALEYAARFPGEVERMALISVPRHESREAAHADYLKGSINYRLICGQPSLKRLFASMLASGPRLAFWYTMRFPKEVITDSTKYTMQSLISTLEHCLLDYRMDGLVRRLPDVPLLILHGERDQVAPLANVRDLPKQSPNARLITFPDAGHHLYLQIPEKCNRLFLDFFRADLPLPPPEGKAG